MFLVLLGKTRNHLRFLSTGITMKTHFFKGGNERSLPHLI